MRVKYSVIVPVYNAEKTIARCINSLVYTDRADYEIIIVNDGSTDNSKQICFSYTKEHPQIVYIDKERGGVSSARNLGLSIAKGEYILFVDSDDYVCDTYFEVLDSHLHNNCDFLMFGKIVYDGKKERKRLLNERCTDDVESTMKLISKTLTAQLLNSTWNKVFRAEIIRECDLRFDEGLEIGEDKVFVVQYIMYITNALFIKTPLYVVSIENENSLSRSMRDDLCEQILREHELLFGIVNSSNLPHKIKKELLSSVTYSYYRSAYTIIYKFKKISVSRKERLSYSKYICTLYSDNDNCTYGKIGHWLISIPIRWKLVRLIDIGLSNKYF